MPGTFPDIEKIDKNKVWQKSAKNSRGCFYTQACASYLITATTIPILYSDSRLLCFNCLVPVDAVFIMPATHLQFTHIYSISRKRYLINQIYSFQIVHEGLS